MKSHECIEKAAQSMLEVPELTPQFAEQLNGDLRNHYQSTGMMAHQPAKADSRVIKGVRKAAWSSLWHIVTDEVIEDTLHHMSSEGELVIPQPTIDRGSCYAFIETCETMLRDASSRVLSQETDNPYKVYHPIWDQIGELQEHYKVAWQTLRNHHEASGVKSMMVPPKCPAGKDAVTKVWSGAARDIAVTTLWLLANQKQTTSADKDDPQALTNTALGEISTLNWGTTMNRSVNLELFPDLFTDLPDDLDESFFTSRGNIFVQQQRVDSSVCTWAHPSLRSGPWTVQAGCAGGLWLTTPSQKARDNATELFRLAERRSGIPVNGTEAGRYDSGLAILAIGSLIAEKTIYMGAY